ncbi:mediator complex subunit [Serendipita sp. 399]|nr:mediator complex subunit [Serendipita sp. 399]
MDSLLDLLVKWPANQTILEYMEAITRAQILPLHIYFSAFLRNTRQAEYTDPRSPDMLCRLGIQLAAELPLSPVVTMVDPIEPPSTTLLDALTLLREGLQRPYSTVHDLQTSASDVLLLVIQYCSTMIPQFTSGDAIQILAIGHQITQSHSLRPDLLTALEAFNRLLGESLSVANPLPTAGPEILSLGMPPQPEINAEDESEAVSCSLFLRNIVECRAHSYGCGNTEHTLAILTGLYRWNGVALPNFCAEIVRATVLHYSEAFQLKNIEPLLASNWSSFIYGRLPDLLLHFLESVGSNQHQPIMESAMTTVLEKVGRQIDFVLPFQSTLDMDEGSEADSHPSIFRTHFLHAMVKRDLLSPSMAKTLHDGWTEDGAPPVILFDESTSSVEEVVERLVSSGPEEQRQILDLFVKDYAHQGNFSNSLDKKLESLVESLDLFSVASLCEALIGHSSAFDVLALHISVPQVLQRLLTLVDNLDWEDIDDPQMAMTPLGNVILFLQAIIGRYNLSIAALESKEKSISAEYLIQAGSVELASDLSSDEEGVYQNWHTALFDVTSDGVEDSLVRTPSETHAEVLVQLLKNAPPNLGKILYRTLSRIAALALEVDAPKYQMSVTVAINQIIKPSRDQPTLATYSHKLAPVDLIRATLMNIRSNRPAALDVPLCLHLLGAAEFVMKLQTELYPSSQFGDAETYRRISVHALCHTCLQGPDQPWLLPVFLFLTLPNLLARVSIQDTGYIEALAGVITSSFRLSLALDKAFSPAPSSSSFSSSSEPSALLCQRFSQSLKKWMARGGETNSARLLYKTLQSSQPFVAQFPHFP